MLTVTYGERQKPRAVKVKDLVVGHAFRGTFRSSTGLWVKPLASDRLLLIMPDLLEGTSQQAWTMFSNGESEYLHIDQEFASIEVVVNS